MQPVSVPCRGPLEPRNPHISRQREVNRTHERSCTVAQRGSHIYVKHAWWDKPYLKSVTGVRRGAAVNPKKPQFCLFLLQQRSVLKASPAQTKQPQQLWQALTPCQCTQTLPKAPSHPYKEFTGALLSMSSVPLEHLRLYRRNRLHTSGEVRLSLPSTHTCLLFNGRQ